jgi:HK97 family phage prohead protease
MSTTSNPRTIEGWLIRYNSLSLPITLPNGRQVFETILPGAFADSVASINRGEATIEANIEHVDDAISRIGLTGKNVTIEHRAEGVYATVKLVGDTISNDLFLRVQAGLVGGMSVEFKPSPANAEPAYSLANGNYVRTWAKLSLKGFAITASPAYPDAQITKATEGTAAAAAATGPAFTRSIGTAEAARIQSEIEQIETRAAVDRQRDYYEHQKFLLGIAK